MRKRMARRDAGFTMVELIVGLATTLILCAAVVSSMASAERTMRRSEISTALNQQMRATLELLAQDISQAGLSATGFKQAESSNSGGNSYSLTANGNPQPITTITATGADGNTYTVGNADGLFANQWVLIGTGATQQALNIESISGNVITISSASAATQHGVGEPIFGHGVFSDGVVYDTTDTTFTGNSNKYSLRLFGDLRGDGTLSIVRYECPTPDTAVYTDADGTKWGPLKRYEYDGVIDYVIGQPVPAPNSTATLLELVAVDSTNGCFGDFSAQTDTQLVNNKSWMFVTSVSATIQAMAGTVDSNGNVQVLLDPQTHRPTRITKSFLNIQPRNIIVANQLAKYYVANTGGIGDTELLAMPENVKSFLEGLQ